MKAGPLTRRKRFDRIGIIPLEQIRGPSHRTTSDFRRENRARLHMSVLSLQSACSVDRHLRSSSAALY